MNMDKWNALPKDVQKALEDLGTQQAAWTGTYMDNHVDESIAWSQETHKVEVIKLSATEKAQWDALLSPMTAEWIQDGKTKGLPAEAIVNDIKAFAKMYAGE